MYTCIDSGRAYLCTVVGIDALGCDCPHLVDLGLTLLHTTQHTLQLTLQLLIKVERDRGGGLSQEGVGYVKRVHAGGIVGPIVLWVVTSCDRTSLCVSWCLDLAFMSSSRSSADKPPNCHTHKVHK